MWLGGLKFKTSKTSIKNTRGAFVAKKIFVFIAAILLSTTLVASSGIQVSAIDKNSINDQAYTYATYNAMYDCLKQTDQQADNSGFIAVQVRTTEAHIKSGDWWRTEGVGYWGTTQGAESQASYFNGKVHKINGNSVCNDILSDAIQLFGYANYLDFACSFTTIRANGSSCKTGTDDFGPLDYNGAADKYLQVVGKKVWGTATPSLSLDKKDEAAAKYVLYKQAFIVGCQARVSTNPGNGYGYTDIKIVSADGTSTTKTYEGVSTGDSRVVYRNSPTSEDKETCENIAGHVNQYAGAYVSYMNSNPADKGGSLTVTPGVTPDAGTSCNIPGLGWIACPIINTVSTAADGMYGAVSSILNINPLSRNGAEYKTWQGLRDIANVLLVIGFLFVIFSQATSIGISNYSIKKMLPRIILVAIGINLSFFLVQVAIDISNILGQAVYDLINGYANTDAAVNISWANMMGQLITATTVIGGGIAAIIMSQGVWAAAIAAMPFLVLAGLAILAAFITLYVRNALIIILVIVSPIAIALYILPNTEEWFTKWRKMLMSMLLLYPLASLLFAGAKFAGHILMNADDPFNSVIGLFITAAPLFALPWLARSSGGIMAKVGGTLQGFAKRGQKAAEHATEPYKKAAQMRYMGGEAGRRDFLRKGTQGLANRRHRIESIAASREEEYKLKQAEEFNKEVAPVDKETGETLTSDLSRDMTIGGRRAADDESAKNAVRRVQARAAENINKLEDANENSAKVLLQREITALAGKGKNTDSVLERALASKNEYDVLAAQGLLFGQGSSGVGKYYGYIDSLEQSKHFDSDEGRKLHALLNQNLLSQYGGPAKEKAKDLTIAAASGKTLKQVREEQTGVWTGMTDTEIVKSTTDFIVRGMQNGALTQERISKILSDPNIRKDISQDQNELFKQFIDGGSEMVSMRYKDSGSKKGTTEQFEAVSESLRNETISPITLRVSRGSSEAEVKKFADSAGGPLNLSSVDESRFNDLGEALIDHANSDDPDVQGIISAYQTDRERRARVAQRMGRAPTAFPTVTPTPRNIQFNINSAIGTRPASSAEISIQIANRGGINKYSNEDVYGAYQHAISEQNTSPSPDAQQLLETAQIELEKRNIIPGPNNNPNGV